MYGEEQGLKGDTNDQDQKDKAGDTKNDRVKKVKTTVEGG
jgi:hypothetical protein